MKKIIVLCFISLRLFSQIQVTTAGTLSINSISSNSFCLCDTVKIGFKFKSKIPADTTQDYFKLFLRHGQGPTPIFTVVKTFKSSEFFRMEKVQGASLYDTIYYFKYKIPCNFISLYGETSPGASVGAFTAQNVPSATSYFFTVKNCITGISEYEQDKLTPVFYDFYGNVVDPKKGDFLIMIKGTQVSKVLIE